MLSRRAESDVEDVNDAFVRKDFEQTDTAHDIPELKNYCASRLPRRPAAAAATRGAAAALLPPPAERA